MNLVNAGMTDQKAVDLFRELAVSVMKAGGFHTFEICNDYQKAIEKLQSLVKARAVQREEAVNN